jgi:hypothetical protein
MSILDLFQSGLVLSLFSGTFLLAVCIFHPAGVRPTRQAKDLRDCQLICLLALRMLQVTRGKPCARYGDDQHLLTEHFSGHRRSAQCH